MGPIGGAIAQIFCASREETLPYRGGEFSLRRHPLRLAIGLDRYYSELVREIPWLVWRIGFAGTTAHGKRPGDEGHGNDRIAGRSFGSCKISRTAS